MTHPSTRIRARLRRNALSLAMASAGLLSTTPLMATDSHGMDPAPAQAGTVASAAPAPVQASPTASQDGTTNLSTITVTGQLAALRQAQATKRDAVGVVDSVSAEEAGKFPDQNVADALQRVPGVSVDRGGGESNHITVRGFGPTFVNVLLNGRTMATSSGDRSFNFDILPSEIISQAVVHKTGSADLPAGGIGGTVNIITARPLDFDGWHAAGTVAGVNDDVDGGHIQGKWTPKVSGMFGHTNADHTFGWLASVVYYKRDHVQQSVNDSGWYTNQDLSRLGPQYTGLAFPQTVQGQVTRSTRTHKSVSASVDWKPTDALTLQFDSLYAEYKNNSIYNAFGSFSNPDDIQSISADPNGTALTYTRGDTGVLANDYIQQYSPSDAHSEQNGLHVNYQFTPSTELDFDTSESKAWNKPGTDGYFVVMGTRNYGTNPVWTNNGSDHLPSYSNLVSPTDLDDLHAHSFAIGSTNTSHSIFQNRLHLSTTFAEGALSRLDFGIESSQQSKRQIAYHIPDIYAPAEYAGYTVLLPPDAIGAHVFDAGSLVDGVSPGFPHQWVAFDADKLFAYLASPAAYTQSAAKLDPAVYAAALAANGGGYAPSLDANSFHRIDENVRSAYAQARFEGDIGDMPWTLDAGMRYTRTRTKSTAIYAPLISVYIDPNNSSLGQATYGAIQPLSRTGEYHNWLPSASFKLSVLDNLILRLAASKTLTRPNLSDLAINTGYNLAPNALAITTGNAGLKPYVSKNYDAGIEWYINDDSYVSLEGFYKKVDNFTTLVTHPEQVIGYTFQVTEPVNLNQATIKGLEFTFNYQFSGLPSPFDGLGIASNYTHVISNASIDPGTISTTGTFAVPGIGDSANFSTYYQKGPVQVRLAYNWRDAYLSSISGDQGQPTTVKSYGQLDFSSSYAINRHLSVFLDATNLNNEKIFDYQVYENRPSYAETEGRTILAGIRMKL